MRGKRLFMLLSSFVYVGCSSTASWVPHASAPPSLLTDSSVETAQSAPLQDALTALLDSHQSVEAKASGRTLGSTLVYEKAAGTVYPVVARPNLITTVIFPMGEDLLGDVNGGHEQVRFQPFPEAEAKVVRGWILKAGYSGQERARRLQLDITPMTAGLTTTIVVRTTGGFYVIEARSGGKAYQPMVLIHDPTPQVTAGAKVVESLVPLTGRLGLGYDILLTEGQPAPAFAPTSVYDTQELTAFEFSAALKQGEAPQLYWVTPEGERILANRTPKGTRLLLGHGVAPAWELKLGEVVVRVKRREDYTVVTCPGSAGCPTTAQTVQR